jgi:iron complex outermembrane receptor protein
MSLIFPIVLAAANTGTTTTLPDIEITATKPSVISSTQPTAEAAKERLNTIPGGANIVETKSFTEGRVSTLSDALGYATGVFIQPRFGAEEARLSIRGSGIQRTFHGRGLRLLQDGIPVNLSDGSFDFQAIEPLATQYIEVIRGANAMGYGAANLGGVVNYISETGLTAPRASARLEAGSFGYFRLQGQAAVKSDTADAYATITEFKQDGFRDHAKQEGLKGIANVGFRPNESIETRFFVASVRSDSELPGSLTKQQLFNNPRQANATSAQLDQKRDLDIDRLANRTVIRLPLGTLDISAFVSAKKLFHPINPWIEQSNIDWGGALKYSVDYKAFKLPTTSVAGISPYKGVTRQKLFSRFTNRTGQIKGPLIDDSVQTAKGYDVFIEQQLHFTSQWTGIVGLQYSKSDRKVDDLLPTTGTPADGSYFRSFSRTSPRIGAIYQVAPKVQAYANVSGSFEPPSFSELGATSTPTANNKAQRATTAEIGTRGELNGWNWDIAAYYAKVKDELLVLNTGVPNQTATINADKTIHAGLDAGVSKTWGQGWLARSSLLVNQFKFDGDKNFGDNTLAGIPKASVRLALEKQFSPYLKTALSVEAAKRTPVDLANTLYALGYGVLNARANGKIIQNIDWFVDVRNLADKKYAASTGVINNATGLDQAQFLPGDGRSYFTGINVRW